MRPQPRRSVLRSLVVGFAVVIGLNIPLAISSRAQGQQTSDQNDSAQVMTRGPVHEAFAAPAISDPKPGPIVPIEPPQAVEEQPPDQKPVGESVQWIPGYWQWDEGRNDFLWISGVWRDPPPGRQWVPGYWNHVTSGYQWVPGAWTPIPQPQASGGSNANVAAGSGQSQYLPSPPPTLEAGPNSPMPAGQVFWSPGCWTWQGLRFVWRPGFWAAVQPGWVWMPAQYVWTPSGYLYVPGYWDLAIASRGLMFAPVYYPQPLYLQPGYVFTPSVTIMSPAFTANLFVQPAYSHYCFGDYYAQSFLSIGIFPWFSMSVATGPAMPRYYDPLFTYYSVVNVRNDPRWVTRVQEEYIVRRDNIALRPPRSLVEQTRLMRSEGERSGHERLQVMARPVGELASHPGETHGLQLERLDAASRRQWQTKAAEIDRYRDQRVAQEREGARDIAATRARGETQFKPRPLNLAHSPVAARPVTAHSGTAAHNAASERRGEQMAHSGEVRSRQESLRPSESNTSHASGHNEGHAFEGQEEEHVGRSAENLRSTNSHVFEQPGMRGNAHQGNQGQATGRGPIERRLPPHPTPIPHERRERERG